MSVVWAHWKRTEGPGNLLLSFLIPQKAVNPQKQKIPRFVGPGNCIALFVIETRAVVPTEGLQITMLGS